MKQEESIQIIIFPFLRYDSMKRKCFFMKSAAVAMLVATLLLAGCSRKGVHMSKHRKSRKCNCPTFAENRMETSTLPAAYYD